MWSRFTQQAKRVVFYAQEDALAQGGTDVASEHLLLGVIQEVTTHKTLKADETVWPPAPTDRLDPRNPVALLLRQFVGDLEELRLQTKMYAAKLNSRADTEEIGLTRSAKRVIDVMYQEAKRAAASGQEQIGAEFLLLALAQDESGKAGQLLVQFGFDLEVARHKVAILHLPVKEDKPSKPSPLSNFTKRFLGKPKDK